MRIAAIVTLLLVAVACPATAQTRDDLRGPTGKQQVALPPGVKGATGGGSAGGGHTGARCRMMMRHHHRVRTCRPARG